MSPIIFESVMMMAPSGAPNILSPAVLPAGTQGTAYSYTMLANGGQLPYTWSLTSGTLDSGVTLSSAGVLSGTPANAETDIVTIKVTDSRGLSSSKIFNLMFAASGSPLSISSTSPLPNAIVNKPYSFTMVASGGTPPYSWAILSGSLSSGLTFSSGGVFGGTPTNAETDTVVIQVTDSLSNTAQKTFTLTVGVGLPLGVNLNTFAYAQPQNAFVNILKQASQFDGVYPVMWQNYPSNAGLATPWITEDASGVGTNESGCIPLDSDSNPISLIFSPVPPGGQKGTRVKTIVTLTQVTQAGATAPYHGGPYTVSGTGIGSGYFTSGAGDVNSLVGNANITISGTRFTSSTAGAWSFTCTVSPTSGGSGGFTLTLDQINVATPIKVLGMYETANASLFATNQYWHPNYLDMSKNFTCFRFMKPMDTEGMEIDATLSGNATGTSATFKDACNMTASVTGGVLTVTATNSLIHAGMYYTGAGISVGARIKLQTSGGFGGTGTYTVTNASDTTGLISMTGLGTWMHQSGVYRVVFTTGETRDVTLTSQSNTLSWTGALTVSPGAGPDISIMPWVNWPGRRPLTTSFSWATPMGIPVEAAVQLCNIVGADFHDNYPFMAGFTDGVNFSGAQHLTPRSALIKSLLNSNLLYKPEGGNETWNSQYNSTRVAHYLGLGKWPTKGPSYAMPFALAGAPAASATSGTLAAPWPYDNIILNINFSTGEGHQATFVAGNAAFTWIGGLNAGNTATITCQPNYSLNRNWIGRAAALAAQQFQTDWGVDFASRVYPIIGSQYFDSGSNLTEAMATSYWFASDAHRASDSTYGPLLKLCVVAPYFGGLNNGLSQVYPTAATECMIECGRSLAQQVDDWLLLMNSNVLHSFTFTAPVALTDTTATLSTGIYGGVATTQTFLAAVGANDTSATLSSAWAGSTQGLVTLFSNAVQRTVQYTNGSTAVSFSQLNSTATNTVTLVAQSLGVQFSTGEQKGVTFTPGSATVSWTGVLGTAATATANFIAVAFTPISFTAPISAVATTATLTSNWTLSSGGRTVQFSNGIQKTVTFTNGTAGVSFAALGTAASATANFVATDQPAAGSVGLTQAYLHYYTSLTGPTGTYPNLNLGAYEGGPNHGFGGNPSTAWRNLLIAGMDDPRMQTVIINFLQWWATNVGSARVNSFAYFLNCDPNGANAYGAAYSGMQKFTPISTGPNKWKALQNYMGFT